MSKIIRKLGHFFTDTFWYIRDRFWCKYHMLDLRDNHYKYKYGYMDPCDQILLANFRILADHVETLPKYFKMSKPNRAKCEDDWEYELLVEQYRHYLEMMRLYLYWTIDRPAIIRDMKLELSTASEKDTKLKYEKYNNLEDELNKKDEENLIALMKLRNYLWT